MTGSTATGTGDRPGDPRLEVRWITEGGTPELVAADAEQLPEAEERVDWYAPVAHPDVGIKARGGAQLDVKVRVDGAIDVAGPGVSGAAEAWVRHELDAHPAVPGPGWVPVAKERRQVHLASGDRRASVEITRLTVGTQREPAWTVAVEVWGPPWGGAELVRVLDETLGRTAGADVLGRDVCRSYPAWLAGRATSAGAAGPARSPARADDTAVS